MDPAGWWLLAAWIDDFQRIGWITLVVLGVLTALAKIALVFAMLALFLTSYFVG